MDQVTYSYKTDNDALNLTNDVDYDYIGFSSVHCTHLMTVIVFWQHQGPEREAKNDDEDDDDDDASHETMKWRVQLDNDVKCNENFSNASCSVIGQQNTLLRLTVIRSDECVWVEGKDSVLTFRCESPPLTQTTSCFCMINSSFINFKRTSYVLLVCSSYKRASPVFVCWKSKKQTC